jgi:hypothetical protein
MGTESLGGHNRNSAGSERLCRALLAIGAAAVGTGLGIAGRVARFAGDTAARAVEVTPLRPEMLRLNDRWDEDRRALLKRLDRSITSVIDIVLDRIDLTRIVIERVDVNRIIEERVDIDGVIGRADVAGMARDVIHQLDLPEIVRDSSGTMAAETVESLRLRGMDADLFLSKLVDRVLHRANAREASSARLGQSLPGSPS